MECHCIPAVELPHTSKLYSTYLQNFAALSEYYGHPPTIDAIKQVAGEVRPEPTQRKAVAAVLRAQNRAFGADPTVEAALDRFAAGATAIVSGQQVGLFSGPSYTIYKALTAVRAAQDLTAAGTPAVAIFWLATEDHDLAEINHTYWATKGGSERLELPADGTNARRVGELPLGDAVSALVERATSLLEGPSAEEISKALRDAYRPSENYGSALGKLMARIFAGKGLILLDALSPELHRLVAPLHRAALEQHAELNKDLIERGKALDAAGYHAQVKVTDRSTLLFSSRDGDRQPIRVGGSPDEFLLGERKLTRQELLQWIADAPESISPNVLLRPVVQDTLLSTAAYVAGPAEVAYFAQASVVYRRLLGRMPVILPRAGVTLVDAQAQRLLKKYGLEFTDVVRGRQPLRAKMERDLIPPEIAQRFGCGEKSIKKLMERLREPIAKLDPTLVGSLDNAGSKMLYQLANLQGKVAHAVAFRSQVLDGHERELLAALYPNDALQERSLCLLPFLARQGMGLLDELSRCITPGGAQHNVLYL